MNVLVRAPLKADDIKELLDGNTYEGYTFNFIKKVGIDMDFDVIGEGAKDPADVAKSIIKAAPYGAALYFSVVKK